MRAPPIYSAFSAGQDLPPHSLKLGTLLNLRWLSAAGQLLGSLFVEFGLRYPLPIWSCLFLVLLSVALNLALRWHFPQNHRLPTRHALALLGFDILQLGAFLFFTGGLDNPFSFLLLAPVLVSASTLPSSTTLALGGLAGGMATILAVFHMELPWAGEETPYLPPIYLVGVWIALLTTLGFSAVFAFRLSDEARQLAEALAAVELVLAREHHLSALDGLAAAAAHELGTPLGTIALVARELEREVTPGTQIATDIALIKSQSDRCREILRKLSSMASEGDAYFDRLPLRALVDEVVEPFQSFGPDIRVHAIGNEPEPVGLRNPAILHGLTNIVENAVGFAAARVDILASWTVDTVRIEIRDDGPGFAPDVRDRLGEPFVARRGDRSPPRGASPSRADGPRRDEMRGDGLGLGFFIASTLLRRSGASVRHGNRPPEQSGAVVVVEWPYAVFIEGAAGGAGQKYDQ